MLLSQLPADLRVLQNYCCFHSCAETKPHTAEMWKDAELASLHQLQGGNPAIQATKLLSLTPKAGSPLGIWEVQYKASLPKIRAIPQMGVWGPG